MFAGGQSSAGLFGNSHLLGGYWGCQAEYVRVPFGNVNCLPIPDVVSDEHALMLTDVLPTSFHALQLAEVQKGDVVGIWGLGPIGLAAARWCQIIGCSQVIGIDCVDYRLLTARQMGVTTINFQERDVLQTIEEITKKRGLDAAIEAAGCEFAKGFAHKLQRALMLETDTPEILTECSKAVRKNGHVGIVGTYTGFCNEFPIGMIQMKHLHLAAGVVNLHDVWRKSLEALQSGQFNPSFLISHIVALSDVPECYKKFNDHEDGMLKIVARPHCHDSRNTNPDVVVSGKTSVGQTAA